MAMGRHRKTNRHLPQRVYMKHEAFYFVTHESKWIFLGKNYATAMHEWAKLVDQSQKVTRMADLFDRYMLEVAPSKAGQTYKDNQREIKPLRLFFGDMRPDNVEPIHVYKYLDTRGKKAKVRANREKSLLSHIFSKAIEWGIVRDNPCKDVKRLTEKPRDRYVEDWELRTLVDGAPELIRHYVAFKYLTGLRQQDILNLRLDALQKDGIHVTTRKTGKRIIIEWNEDLRTVVDAIRSMRNIKSLHLFGTRKGQPYSADGFRSIWHRCMFKATREGRVKQRFTEHDMMQTRQA